MQMWSDATAATKPNKNSSKKKIKPEETYIIKKNKGVWVDLDRWPAGLKFNYIFIYLFF